jgi:two-component system NtrC family sensor kinase
LLTRRTLSVCTWRTEIQQAGRPGVLPAVAVEIHDTGKGIPVEVMQHLFEPFHTTKQERLGLSISYEIVRVHGGQIQVTSEPGRGTAFTVLLLLEASEDGTDGK